jgi:disulfide bond formation protein DsbB
LRFLSGLFASVGFFGGIWLLVSVLFHPPVLPMMLFGLAIWAVGIVFGITVSRKEVNLNGK